MPSRLRAVRHRAGGNYLIAIQATAATDPVIGAGTTIWLNTDQNNATGYTPLADQYRGRLQRHL